MFSAPSPNLKLVSVVSAPATEPVSLTEAKAWLKVDTSDDDTLITELIQVAREAAENYTRRAFVTQTLKLTLDRFPIYRGNGRFEQDGIFEVSVPYALGADSGQIFLPRAPIQSVTSIVTYDDDNNSSTVSTSIYRLDAVADRVFLNESQTWPTDLRDYAAIEVTYVAGYGAASAVPASIKAAIKMHILRMYDGRTVCDMPSNCMALLDQYRIVDRLVVYG